MRPQPPVRPLPLVVPTAFVRVRIAGAAVRAAGGEREALCSCASAPAALGSR